MFKLDIFYFWFPSKASRSLSTQSDLKASTQGVFKLIEENFVDTIKSKLKFLSFKAIQDLSTQVERQGLPQLPVTGAQCHELLKSTYQNGQDLCGCIY